MVQFPPNFDRSVQFVTFQYDELWFEPRTEFCSVTYYINDKNIPSCLDKIDTPPPINMFSKFKILVL
jgi:hypothetical protein